MAEGRFFESGEIMDGLYACIFFIIFAAALLIYGGVLYKTGDKKLLPLRAQPTIRNEEDVRRVGLISARVALIIAALAVLAIFVFKLH